MDTGQQNLIQLDSTPGAAVGPQETPEQKKLRSVGFYELDVLQAPSKDGTSEDTKAIKSSDVEKQDVLSGEKNGDPDYLDKSEEKTTHASSYLDKAEDKTPHEDGDQSLNYFDQTTTQHSPSNKIVSCLCKECVENLRNKREEVRPASEEHPNDEFLPCEDSVSTDSSRSRSGSEKSRRTNSSEEEHRGHKYQDAQVTLPYPDNGRPTECITRLSNAGLYEPNEDLLVKAKEDLLVKAKEDLLVKANEDLPVKATEEDKISQAANTAFFVHHPSETPSQQKGVQMEMVDIEKGDGETEPFIRTLRRAADEERPDPMICQCNRGCLKIVGSLVTSMIVFPALLYAAYTWLPFDAPLMPDIPTRLVYTLRCASFASFPIVLGVIIHGISRLCASSYDPFKPREREVTIHRRFVKQGTFLFVLYFFNLSVLATYLPQDHLKFIPLLTCLFTLAQLMYWLSFAVSRPFRGFGYGLTFFPLIAMMISNFYFMFLVEPEKMVFLGSRDATHN